MNVNKKMPEKLSWQYRNKKYLNRIEHKKSIYNELSNDELEARYMQLKIEYDFKKDTRLFPVIHFVFFILLFLVGEIKFFEAFINLSILNGGTVNEIGNLVQLGIVSFLVIYMFAAIGVISVMKDRKSIYWDLLIIEQLINIRNSNRGELNE